MTEDEFRNGPAIGRAPHTLEKVIAEINNLADIVTARGNANADEYMRGMANGLILARHVVEDRETDIDYIGPEAVTEFDYMAECDRTCSVEWNPQYVDATMFRRLIESVINTGEQLNLCKKLFVRGKTPADVGFNMPFEEDGLARLKDISEDDLSIMHGIIGVITEAAELAEVLDAFVFGATPFDKVNLVEEVGDVAWYQTRILRGVGASMELMERANIDKLHGRHGSSFDVFRDAHRDLVAERAKLEVASAPLFDSAPAEQFDVYQQPSAAVRASGDDEPCPCEGNSILVPPRPGLIWEDGCWRAQRTPLGDCEGMDC